MLIESFAESFCLERDLCIVVFIVFAENRFIGFYCDLYKF